MKKHLQLLAVLLAMMLPAAMQGQTLFSEDFEGGSMPTGWTTDGPGSWSVGTGDHSSGTGAGQGIYNAKITHGSSGNVTKLITPAINLSGVSSAVLSYMHIERSWGGDIDELHVYYRNDTTGTWTLLSGQAFTSAVDSWTTEADVVLPNLSGTYQIAFEFTDRYGYGLGIDNIVVEQASSCTKPTGLAATLTPGNGTVATLSWTAGGTETYWNVSVTDQYDSTVVDTLVNTTSYSLTGLTPETTYYARVKAVCSATEQSGWCNTVCTFIPTNTYSLTVNDGTATNGYVPIYGYYCDENTKSTFIIPAGSLTAIQYGTINKLTFYASNANVNWGNAQFEVYMTETSATTVSGIADFTTMTQVKTASALAISDHTMEVTLTTPYQYMGGNLMIAFNQPTTGTYSSCSWYGISATGASYGGHGTSVNQQNFLPKMRIDYTPGVAPACLAPTNLAVDNTSVTAHSADLSWSGSASSYIIMLGQETVVLNADFEDNQIPSSFTNDASYPWTAVSSNHSGDYCAKSGNAGVNSSTSEMSVTVTLTTDATLTFSAKISSEDSYDKGYFSIDGTPRINGISGNGAWTDYSYALTAGSHTLRWYYTKDSSVAGNDDCFYVDDIKISIAPSSWDTTRTATASPYTITGLASETTYQVKVIANCGTEGFSQPSAPVSFTTLESCVTPDSPMESYVTSDTAILIWNNTGAASYNIRYRTAGYLDGLIESFPSSPSGWENKAGLLDNVMNGTETLTSGSHWYFGTSNGVFDNHARINIYGSSRKGWLITPAVNLPAGAALNFDLALTAYSGTLGAPATTGTDDRFVVLISTDNETTWTILREWNNSGNAGVGVYNNINSTATGEPVNIDLSGYAGESVRIAFYGESTLQNANNNLHIDNVTIGTPVAAGDWDSVTTVDTTVTIDGLDENTVYEAQVMGVCSATSTSDWSTLGNFSTMYMFSIPVDANKWYAISSPVFDSDDFKMTWSGIRTTPLTAASALFDLYLYEEPNGAWVNKALIDNLERGTGYIYRSSEDAVLEFTGWPNTGDFTVPGGLLNMCVDEDLKGFNLIGNPYDHDAYKGVAITATAYSTNYLSTGWYSLNPDGSWYARLDTEPIAAGQAALVKYAGTGTATNLNFVDVETAPASAKAAPAKTLAFTVNGNGHDDIAYAMLSNGDGLPKIGHLSEEAPMLSIPVEGRRYAIAMLGSSCETFNMVFRGATGTYTLTFDARNARLDYVHLIDKAAGKEIDLLQTPEYTFNATGNDADRFVVKLTPDAEEITTGNFVYWNGNAWVIEGTGTLQMFDILGRRISSEEVDAQTIIHNSQFPGTGVYILRLGEKSQKIVVK